jgi:hypothetical protein
MNRKRFYEKCKSHLVCLIIVFILLAIIAFQFGLTKRPVYLITVTGEGGAVVGPMDEEGCFQLTLKDADHVVWFSDRPYREAWSSHTTDLVDIWEETFAGNPPNADLQLFSDDRSDEAIIVELFSAPVWNEDTQELIFNDACVLLSVIEHELSEGEEDLTTMGGSEIISGEFPKAVLFIDDAMGDAFDDMSKALGNKLIDQERWIKQHVKDTAVWADQTKRDSAWWRGKMGITQEEWDGHIGENIAARVKQIAEAVADWSEPFEKVAEDWKEKAKGSDVDDNVMEWEKAIATEARRWHERTKEQADYWSEQAEKNAGEWNQEAVEDVVEWTARAAEEAQVWSDQAEEAADQWWNNY